MYKIVHIQMYIKEEYFNAIFDLLTLLCNLYCNSFLLINCNVYSILYTLVMSSIGIFQERITGTNAGRTTDGDWYQQE